MKKKFNQKELFTQGLKGCPKCEEIKPLDEFGNDKTKKDGKKGTCKDCYNKSARIRTGSIPDSYAKKLISAQLQISRKQTSNEMIELKRAQIKLKRIRAFINKKIKEKSKGK